MPFIFILKGLSNKQKLFFTSYALWAWGEVMPNIRKGNILTISTTFTYTEVNNCFSIYHTSWITGSPKSNFICDNMPAKAILFFFGCSEVNSTWLVTSELANQRARKVLFTCVVYTKMYYYTVQIMCFQNQGVLPEKSSWSVQPATQNPYPI